MKAFASRCRRCWFRRISFFVSERKPAAGSDVDEYALASRLSYFLWSSMPDEDLVASRRGQDAAQARTSWRRRFAGCSPIRRASALVDNFAAQWLQLRALARSAPDPDRFPKVDEELLDFMRKETKLFVQAVIREDRSILDFLERAIQLPERRAGAALRNSRSLRRGVPTGRTGRQSAARRADSRQRPDRLLLSDANLARAAWQVGARELARRTASSAASRSAGVGGKWGRRIRLAS